MATGCVADPEEVGKAGFEVTVCADGETVSGIDVSKWQGTIDWDAVAGGGIEYAFIRVSDGLDYPDSQFAANWAGAREAGVLRGVYQFFRPGQDPIAQADLLLDAMGTLEDDDLPPVCDLEATDGQSAEVIRTKLQQWLDRIEAATGRVPIIYTGKYFWNDNVASDGFTDYPLWIAQYGPTCPDLPVPWQEWAFFQTSSSGSVAGISGNVDTDLYNGSMADLLEFAGVTVECGDGLCNGSESYTTCAEDCPPCQLIESAGGIVDDDSACFVAGGNPDYIRHEEAGWDQTLEWTHTTDDGAAANYGLWQLVLASSGQYRVEAYLDSGFAQSRQAGYQVEHAGQHDLVVIDQTGHDGWVDIGTFEFAAGAEQWIRVDDNTGEPLSGDVQLVFDAIRLTRVDDDPDDPPENPDHGGTNGAVDEDGYSYSVSGGCSAAGSGSGSWPGLLAILGLALVPRRRRLRRAK